MDYDEFLTRVINEGIAAAKSDYTKPVDKARLKGSIEGFEACRDKTPEGLKTLLMESGVKSHEAYRRVNEKEISDDEYWRLNCFELEVRWVCNVLSGLLMNAGLPTIVPPTARGVMKGAEIVGVKGAGDSK